MTSGSVVIANDLLGVIDHFDSDYAYVADKDNVVRKVLPTAIVEISNPHALAALLYHKVAARVQSNK